MKTYLFFLLTILAFTCTACYKQVNTNVPADALPKEKMIAILTDVHLAEGYLAGLSSHEEKDTLAGIYYASIFKIHEIDSATFNYNMNAYMKAPNDLLAVYNEVLKNLEKDDSQPNNQ